MKIALDKNVYDDWKAGMVVECPKRADGTDTLEQADKYAEAKVRREFEQGF